MAECRLEKQLRSRGRSYSESTTFIDADRASTVRDNDSATATAFTGGATQRTDDELTTPSEMRNETSAAITDDILDNSASQQRVDPTGRHSDVFDVPSAASLSPI